MGYHDGKFDLDLCYITGNLIAMSVPSKGMESWYRNPMQKVADFLDLHHPSRYMIFDTCFERSYPEDVFHNQVKHIKFFGLSS